MSRKMYMSRKMCESDYIFTNTFNVISELVISLISLKDLEDLPCNCLI